MKRSLILLLFFTLSLTLFGSVHVQAAVVKQDTTAQADDVVFTEIGSEEDSVANAVADQDTTTLKPVPGATTSGAEKDPLKTSLWVTFLLGVLAGFAAFVMPCIFPMVPLTVSFFTKRAETKGKGIKAALLYGLSIIVIYVSLGVVITLIWGGAALNELSTDGFFNVFIFLILLVFGISFLGAFEITLPSRFVNKLDEKSDSKGFTGIFFMAATLTVVSFSCTGPLIGGFLTVIDKDLMTPIVAMFGFSLSLAAIFTVFAIFPGMMSSLPKSGGWLNSVKVVLGFLEIALAMKFLSTADLAYHWGILDREVFLAIWIVLSFLLGFYLLGKIKLSHDSDLPYISIPRLFFAGSAFVFAIYMIPGLWGAPLKAISGLVPPLSTQDYVITQGEGAPVAKEKNKTRKYADFLHIPLNIDGFFDYDEAVAYAKEVNKPLFLDFTGHGCVNCRKMEADVWTDPRVLKILKEDYIVVSLYTDDKTELPENEQFDSKILRRKVTSVGLKFKHLQAERFNQISQPYYVLLDTEEQELVSPPIGAEFDKEKYLAYLQKGLTEFAARKK